MNVAPHKSTGLKLTRVHALACLTALLLFHWVSARASAQDPLGSWEEGPAKKAILDFVARVTRQGGPDFVPPPERIATFDNDGTLWIEQPLYTQFVFALDRVKAMAPQHPEWKTQQPFKASTGERQKDSALKRASGNHENPGGLPHRLHQR